MSTDAPETDLSLSRTGAPGHGGRFGLFRLSRLPNLDGSADESRRGRRISWGVRTAIGWVLVLAALSIFARWVAPYSPYKSEVGPLLSGPSLHHPFGTDELGRDVLSRTIYAARVSMLIGLVAPILALFFGTIIGAAAAVGVRWVDEPLMRIMDIILAFPAIVLALAVATILGPSLLTTLVVLTCFYTPILARLVRATIMKQMTEDYVAAAMVTGSSTLRILARHVSRNVMGPILVFLTLVAADAIVFEATLGFLGASVRVPTPTWGNLISGSTLDSLAGAWWTVFFPGLALFTCVLALNVISEGLPGGAGGAARDAS